MLFRSEVLLTALAGKATSRKFSLEGITCPHADEKPFWTKAPRNLGYFDPDNRLSPNMTPAKLSWSRAHGTVAYLWSWLSSDPFVRKILTGEFSVYFDQDEQTSYKCKADSVFADIAIAVHIVMTFDVNSSAGYKQVNGSLGYLDPRSGIPTGLVLFSYWWMTHVILAALHHTVYIDGEGAAPQDVTGEFPVYRLVPRRIKWDMSLDLAFRVS